MSLPTGGGERVYCVPLRDGWKFVAVTHRKVLEVSAEALCEEVRRPMSRDELSDALSALFAKWPHLAELERCIFTK
jgi:hypothetical protein